MCDANPPSDNKEAGYHSPKDNEHHGRGDVANCGRGESDGESHDNHACTWAFDTWSRKSP